MPILDSKESKWRERVLLPTQKSYPIMPNNNNNEKLVLLTYHGQVMVFTREEYKEFTDNLQDNLHELSTK